MSKTRMISTLAVVVAYLGICGQAFAEAGPVAYWKLDEGMGTTAYDWVGGNHGTLIADTTWLAGVIGNSCLEFDGAGDYVDCGNDSSLRINDYLTICAWVKKANAGATWQRLVGRYADHDYTLQFNGEGKLSLAVYGIESYSGQTPVAVGEWHHVAATYDRSRRQIRLYVDGQFDGQHEQVGLITTSAKNLRISDDHAVFAYAGAVDEVILFHRVLSDEEIAATYADGLKGYGYPLGPQPAMNMLEHAMAQKQAMLERMQQLANIEAQAREEFDQILARGDYGDLKKGDIIKANEKTHSAMQHQQQTIHALQRSIEKLLSALESLGWDPAALPEPLAWWKFDEPDGNIAYDSAGSYDAVLTNGPARVGGISNGALSFDGINDFVLGPGSPFDFDNDTFTVSAWFATTTGGAIISEGAYDRGGWQLMVYPDGKILVQLKGLNASGGNVDAYRMTSIGTYGDGLWHHLAIVVTTSTVSAAGNHAHIYVDGILVPADETRIWPYRPSNDLVTIGARQEGFTTRYAGLLDEIMVFDKPFSPEQIQSLYAASAD